MPNLPHARPVVLLLVPEAVPTAALERTRGSLAGFEVREFSEADASLRARLAEVVAAFPGRDIACVRAGAELPFAWDARLAKAAHAAARIAAAVPLCDVSPLHALVPDEHRGTAAARAEAIDRSAYCMGTRSYYETPALHVACAYLRGDVLGELLEAVGEEGGAELLLNRIAAAGRERGWQSVVCDYVYVGFEGPRQQEAAGVDPVEVSAFLRHSPLGSLRRAIAEAIALGLPPVSMPALDERPVQLHIMHFWGGGLDKWVRDFGRADGGRTHLLLATYRIGESGGQRIVLYSDPEARIPVHTWDIAQPLRSTAAACLEYARILEQVVREYAVESIVVSSLIGHSLEALRQPVKTVVVCHDFYPLCQAINPYFDPVCANCGAGELARCAQRNPHHETLGSPTPGQWQALRDAYVQAIVERGIEVVVPTAGVAEILRRLEPRMAQVPIHVIAHGMDFAPEKLPPPEVDPARPLRLVVLGRLAENKGAVLLESAAEGLRPLAEITLVGCGPHALELARRCGWRAVEEYRLEELPRLLGEIAPHAALLASVVPETFSYTLSELWALGIPPVATALGSFRERIRDGVDGILFEPDAEALVRTVAGLRADPARLQRIAREVAALPPPRRAAEMVRDYGALLPAGRRPVARFEVGIGTMSALTEPYRHLNEAYAELTAAYERMSEAYERSSAAYEHTRCEYERVRAELERLEQARALWEQCAAELEALNVARRPWRVREAERLVSEMRSRTQISAPPPAVADKKVGT